jgi:dTDP-4-dehydrorhamnose 3,5-epimerase-like enzyme
MELYRRIEKYFQHTDPRGSIVGLLNTGTWHEVNLITSDAGVIRGGHYHKLTEECFLILTGSILVKFRRPVEHGQDVREDVLFHAGDVFVVNPFVEHTFEVLEKATWINLLSIPMDTKNPDFYKYTSDANR